MARLINCVSPASLLIIVLLVKFLCAADTANAQPGGMRAIQRAVNTNIREALNREFVSITLPPTIASVSNVSIDPEGKWMLESRSDGAVNLWDLSTGRFSRTKIRNIAQYSDIKLMSANKLFAINADNSLVVINVKSGRVAKSVKLPAKSDVAGYAVSVDLKTAVAVSVSGMLQVVDVDLGRVTLSVSVGATPSGSVALSDFDNLAVVGTLNGVASLWDLQTGLQIANKKIAITPIGEVSFGFSNDELWLLTASGDLYFSNTQGGQPRQICAEKCGRISDFDLTKDKQQLLVASVDGEAHMLNTRGQVLSAVRYAESVDDVKPVKVGTLNAEKQFFSTVENGKIVSLHKVSDAEDNSIKLISNDGHWLSIDARGRYDGTSNAALETEWTGDTFTAPVAGFSQDYYEPGLIRKWYGDKSYLVSPRPLSEGVLPTPNVDLSIEIASISRENKTINVVVRAKSKSGGLGEVFLFHQGLRVHPNRVVNERVTREDQQIEKRIEYKLRALDGLNRISVSAENAERILGSYTSKDISIDNQAATRNLHILAVGINKYRISRLRLNYAAIDAQSIVDEVTKVAAPLYDNINVEVLVDEDAEMDNIAKAFKRLQTANPEDTVMVYLAGHGEVFEDEFFFLTRRIKYPFRMSNIRKTGLSFAKLQDFVSRMDARKVLLMIDSCKSGDALVNIDSADQDRRSLKVFGDKLGAHFIAATAKSQLATELDELGHGVFTYSVIEALRGNADNLPKDGLISILELRDFTVNNVTRLSEVYSTKPQLPTSYSNGFDFALSKVDD